MIRSEIVNLLIEHRGDYYTIAKFNWHVEESGVGYFLHLPFLVDTRGALRRFEIKGPAGTQSNIDFEAEGITTTHDLKYSHHPSGDAHFSKSGKVVTSIRNRTRPLENYVGPLFYLFFWGLNGFEKAKKQKHLPRLHPSESSVVVGNVPPSMGERRVCGAIVGRLSHGGAENRISLSAEQWTRPLLLRQGTERYIGQPLTPPVADPANTVITMTWHTIKERYLQRIPRMAFTGGFYDDLPPSDPNSTLTGIAMMYGVQNFEEIRRNLGSSDLVTNPKWMEADEQPTNVALGTL